MARAPSVSVGPPWVVSKTGNNFLKPATFAGGAHVSLARRREEVRSISRALSFAKIRPAVKWLIR